MSIPESSGRGGSVNSISLFGRVCRVQGAKKSAGRMLGSYGAGVGAASVVLAARSRAEDVAEGTNW